MQNDQYSYASVELKTKRHRPDWQLSRSDETGGLPQILARLLLQGGRVSARSLVYPVRLQFPKSIRNPASMEAVKPWAGRGWSS